MQLRLLIKRVSFIRKSQRERGHPEGKALNIQIFKPHYPKLETTLVTTLDRTIRQSQFKFNSELFEANFSQL